jgi:hypothetical protein
LTERYAKITDWLLFYKNQKECLTGLDIKRDDVPEDILEDKKKFYEFIESKISEKKNKNTTNYSLSEFKE